MAIHRARLFGTVLVIAALLAGPPALAQGAGAQEKGAADINAEVDKIFSWATPAVPGCSVAAAQNGKVVVNRAYGSADLERDVPLKPESIYDIGSLQKQFVAASILLLVEEKKLALDDDIRKYIKELPDYGHKITIDNLLTHTSGIRDWTGMLMLAEGKPEVMTLILRQRSLNSVPGEDFFYSNSNFVLAKEIVARVSGTSFTEFARKRLFEPLGMKSTSYSVNMREVVKNRALAYDREPTGWRMAMMLDNERGGGGILSTAGDLLIWNDALAQNRLGAFVSEKIHEPATLSNGRKLNIGRGVFFETTRGTRVIWYSGSADGYKSFLVRFPEQAIHIAITCNSGDGTDRGDFARRIFALLAPSVTLGDSLPPVAAAGVDVATLDLNSRAGVYVNERTGEPLRLGVQSGRLRIANGPPLVAQSKERFKVARPSVNFMSQDEFELQFVSADQIELKSMEGKITKYRRAQPPALAPADLQAFAGRYESKEIGAVFQVAPAENGLTVRLEHSPDRMLNIRPLERDTFVISMMVFRFERDSAGKVVAIDYNNPLVRNVKFARLPER